MGTRAMALRRLGPGIGLFKASVVGKDAQMAPKCCSSSMHTHVFWSPSIQRHGFFSASCFAQSSMHFQRNTVYMRSSLLPALHIRATHDVSQAQHILNGCEDHEFSDTHSHLACKDHDIHEAGTALRDYIRETLNVTLSDAAAVVEHAPSFVEHLVVVTKQETTYIEVGEGDLDSMFSGKVQGFLNSKGINTLEPVLESIGVTHEHIEDLLGKLCLETADMQTLLSLIRTFEKVGVPRSSIGGMINKDLRVLSFTEEEIDMGLRVLKGLMISEDELLSLIGVYPLILKTEVVNNIDLLREELGEFMSKDVIVKRALYYNAERVHMYRRGCAKEVVDFLKRYDFTVERIDRILQKHACLVLTDVEKKLKCNVQFLDDLGLSKALIYKVVNRCPNFLLYSVENNLMAKLDYFKSLGFDEAEFCQVISRFPNIFSVSVENKIKPAVAELRTLGLSERGLKKIVLYRPCLFGYKLGGDISALVKQLNLSSYPEDQKVTAFIKLYSRGAEHKKKCEDCLVQHGLSVAEAKEVLEKEPGVLGYNEHALAIKLEGLTKTLGIPIHDVLAVPEYLSFGLRKRVQRRQRVLSYMKSKGLLTGALTLKQLVLHSNTHFYNAFVKSHFEDKELSKMWLKDRDSVHIRSDPNSSANLSQGSSEAAQVSH
eukprot:c23546_g1_i1 orf=784-2754(-)